MRIKAVTFKTLWIALASIAFAAQSQAAEWKKFTSEKGDFIVLLPGTPKEREGSVRSKGDAHEFTVQQGGSAYSVIYIDFDASVSFLTPEQTLNSFVTGGIKADKKNKIIGERPITLKGYVGRALKFRSTDGYVARAKVFFVKRRLYQLTVAGATDKQVDNKDADNFLNSFDLIGKYEPTAEVVTWQPFAPEREGFTVLMPGKPQREQDPPFQTAFGQVSGYSYMTMGTSGLYGVSYSDYPVAVTQTEPKKVLDGERDRIVNGAKLKLASEKDITLGEYSGKEMTLELPQNMLSRSRMYLVKQRLYQISAIYPKARQDLPELQKDIDKYLNSFQLVPAQ